MISLTLKGADELAQRFAAMPSAVHDGLSRVVNRLGLALQASVQNDKLSGQVLQARTGTLRASITADVIDTPSGLSVQIGSDVPYAAIQEYGGQTPAHEIRALKAKALAFMLGGKLVFAKSVQHPGSKIPERSFLRSSLSEMAPDIVDAMKAAVSEAMSS